MESAVIAAIISAITAVVSAVGTTTATALRNKKQRQEQLADRAHEEEYNSPSSVIGRLQDANLNPNLYFGGSGQVFQTQSQPVNYDQAPFDIDGSSISSAIMQGEQAENQKKSIQLQEAMNEANINYMALRSKEQEMQNQVFMEKHKNELANSEAQRNHLAAQDRQIDKEILEIDERIKTLQNDRNIANRDILIKEAQSRQQILVMKKQISHMDASISNLGQQGNYYQQQANLAIAKEYAQFLENTMKNATFDNEVAFKLGSYLNDINKGLEEITKLQKENKWFESSKIAEQISTYIHSFTELMNAQSNFISAAAQAGQ